MRSLERILIADCGTGSAGRAAARVALFGSEQPGTMPELFTFGSAGAAEVVGIQGRYPPSVACPLPAGDTAPSAVATTFDAERIASAIAAQAGVCNADLTIVDGAMFSGASDRSAAIVSLLDAVASPLLIVNRDPVRRYESVLVATDFSEPSRRAARWALALTPSAYLIFLHAWERPQIPQASEAMPTHPALADPEQLRQTMNRFIDSLGKSRRMMSRAIVEGPAAPTIAAHAVRAEVDLIAFGCPTRADRHGRMARQVARPLAACADCDLLIVPAAGDEFDDHPPAA